MCQAYSCWNYHVSYELSALTYTKTNSDPDEMIMWQERAGENIHNSCHISREGAIR